MYIIFEQLDKDKYRLLSVNRVKTLSEIPERYIRESKDYMYFDEDKNTLNINSLRANISKKLVVNETIFNENTKNILLQVIRCAMNEYEARKNGISPSVYSNVDKIIITTH